MSRLYSIYRGKKLSWNLALVFRGSLWDWDAHGVMFFWVFSLLSCELSHRVLQVIFVHIFVVHCNNNKHADDKQHEKSVEEELCCGFFNDMGS